MSATPTLAATYPIKPDSTHLALSPTMGTPRHCLAVCFYPCLLSRYRCENSKGPTPVLKVYQEAPQGRVKLARHRLKITSRSAAKVMRGAVRGRPWYTLDLSLGRTRRNHPRG